MYLIECFLKRVAVQLMKKFNGNQSKFFSLLISIHILEDIPEKLKPLSLSQDAFERVLLVSFSQWITLACLSLEVWCIYRRDLYCILGIRRDVSGHGSLLDQLVFLLLLQQPISNLVLEGETKLVLVVCSWVLQLRRVYVSLGPCWHHKKLNS